jgi:hypothetical protein
MTSGIANTLLQQLRGAISQRNTAQVAPTPVQGAPVESQMRTTPPSSPSSNAEETHRKWGYANIPFKHREEIFRVVLAELWTLIAEPVIRALKLINSVENGIPSSFMVVPHWSIGISASPCSWFIQ